MLPMFAARISRRGPMFMLTKVLHGQLQQFDLLPCSCAVTARLAVMQWMLNYAAIPFIALRNLR